MQHCYHRHGRERRGKRPFYAGRPLLILPLSFMVVWITWFGIVAADGDSVPVPDVSVPPLETETDALPTEKAVASPASPIISEFVVYLPLLRTLETTEGCSLNSQESEILSLARSDPNQERPFMNCDPTLSQVAWDKARDMAERAYFNHVDPDGYGPNYKVQLAGYTLPGYYSQSNDGNNIESIAAGFVGAEFVWTAWKGSSGHRVHVLGESAFFAGQTNIGIGYYYAPGSPYQHYWVFLSAPPE